MDYSSTGSLVTQTLNFRADYDSVLSEAIFVMANLGRKRPNVDRLLGKVSGVVKKKATPFRRCHAELTVTKQSAQTSVFIAIRCEDDAEVNREFSKRTLRQIATWLYSDGKLQPII